MSEGIDNRQKRVPMGQLQRMPDDLDLPCPVCGYVSCDGKHPEDDGLTPEQLALRQYGRDKDIAKRIAKRAEPQPPTLRDQFAMVALTGLLPLWASVEGEAEELRLDVVTEAYAIADAMLIVRVR